MLSVALAMLFLYTLYWFIDIYTVWATALLLTLDPYASDGDDQRYLNTHAVIGQLSVYGQIPAWALMVSQIPG